MNPAEIQAAARRLDSVVVRTPLLAAPWAGGNGTLELKPESLQPTGSFKLRGAYNAIARLDANTRCRGVVTHSSGNHAQAVAYAAREFAIPASIVMPAGTPEVKQAATRALGAEVVMVPAERREQAAGDLADRYGRVIVPPYDHRDIIAGQGTVGLEIAADAPDVSTVLVPVSGGGLASGIGTALRELCPSVRVVGVEPELAADTRQSLRAGALRRWSVSARSRTVADGLRAQPSEFTFAHLRRVLDDIVTVTEDEIRAAVGTAARRARLVAEPSGVVSLAAFLGRGPELPDGRTVAVISGGSVDPALLREVMPER